MGYQKVLAGLALSASLIAGTASAQDMAFFRIGTGGTGGTYYPIGGLLANAISNPPGSRACDEGGSCGVPGLIASALSANAGQCPSDSAKARSRPLRPSAAVMISKPSRRSTRLIKLEI